ncbi:MAG: TolC family protein [Prolixibacteraceae bacterium]|nr:TolC family protein [Prolixibacteraceae bacterium]
MKQFITTIFLLILAFSLSAQNNLSLLNAIEKALENNYEIRIQEMNEQVSELNNNWGTAGRYPSISVSSKSNNERNFNDTDNYNQFQILGGINLDWVLFDGFKVNITKQKLNELEKLTKGFTSVLVEGTLQSVLLAYYKVLLQEEILEVYRANEQLSNDRFAYEKMRKELGNAVSYEVLQAQNAYLADQSDVFLQDANVKASKRDLAYLMGQETLDFVLTDSLQNSFEAYSLELLEASMFDKNKTLLNQYINQTLLAKDLASAKANYMPKLSMNAGAQMSNFNKNYDSALEESSNSSYAFGNFTLSYSIFNGGVRKRAVQIAAIEEEIGQVEIDEMKLSLSNKLATLLDFYNARRSIYNLSNERLKVAQINLSISEEKLKAGTINSFNYRDVQLNYQNAAIAQLNALYSLLESKTSIQRIAGQIISEE